MLTEFGKILRKIRIDRQELLRDMACNLGISPAYLSAVENGKRKAPGSWLDKIISDYCLNSAEASELRRAFEESQEEIRIALDEVSSQKRNVAISFAKALDGLTDEELKKIMSVIQKGSKKPANKKSSPI